MFINVAPRISTHIAYPKHKFCSFSLEGVEKWPLFSFFCFPFSCVKYNFLVFWPCHWRWTPDRGWTHANSNVRRAVWYVLFQVQGRRAKIQEWAACTTDQWWQITSRPSDEKTFQGALWWGEVAAITPSHILKINTCFHTSSLPEVNSFSQVGHPVADPYFWNVGGQETSVAPRGGWGTELLI